MIDLSQTLRDLSCIQLFIYLLFFFFFENLVVFTYIAEGCVCDAIFPPLSTCTHTRYIYGPI